MRENQLKKTLKSGGVALGTLLWDSEDAASSIR